MKITTVQDLSNVSSWEDLRKYCSMVVSDIVRTINGNVDLVDNASTSLVGVTFSAANTQFSFEHTLNRVPSGYITAALSANMVLFNGTTKNSDSKIYLQSSAIGNGKVLVF